jgi:glycosyltransferase 2 family protein
VPGPASEGSGAAVAPRGKGRGRIVTSVLLLVVVFAVFSLVGDVRSLGASLASFHYPALAAALGLVLGNYLIRFVRWQYYLSVIGARVPVGLSGLVFVSGFVMSVTPGKMGEVFKSLLLHEYEGVSVARTAPVVVAERLLDLVALVVLVSIGSAAFEHGRAIAVLGALVVLAIVLGCTVRPLAELVFRLLERVGPARKLVPKLREAYDSLQALTRPRPFLVGGVYALAGWALECCATYVLVGGFPGASVSWDGATFSYAAGTLAGALAMLPGGLGVAEAGMSGLLRAAAPALPLATAAAATILVRLSTLWFGVGLGGLGLLVLRSTHTKKSAA